MDDITIIIIAIGLLFLISSNKETFRNTPFEPDNTLLNRGPFDYQDEFPSFHIL